MKKREKMNINEHTFSYEIGGIKRTWKVIDIWKAAESKCAATVYLTVFDILDSKAWGENLTNSKFIEHYQRVERADLSYPIIILNDEDLQDSCIIDGHHRVIKAMIEDREIVSVKELSWDELLEIEHTKEVTDG